MTHSQVDLKKESTHKTESARTLCLPGFLRKGCDFLHFIEMEQIVFKATPEALSPLAASEPSSGLRVPSSPACPFFPCLLTPEEIHLKRNEMLGHQIFKNTRRSKPAWAMGLVCEGQVIPDCRWQAGLEVQRTGNMIADRARAARQVKYKRPP